MPSMLLPDPAPQRVRAPLTDAIVRHRNILWGTLVVVYALAFNGTWRVGRDSALYRGLADTIATGRGYSFGVFGSREIYPGFPVLLAGLQKLFGRSDLPPILLVHLFSLGVLIFTYKLVRLHYPQWVAIIVTFCVGINGWFLELTNEMLADIPFLCGMMMALYWWERLRMEILAGSESPKQHRANLIKSILWLLVGMFIAAVMRPTFMILGVAWVMVCLWGIFVGPKRRFYAICLAILVVAWITFALIDPRVRGFNPMGGGYEQEALAARGHLVANILDNLSAEKRSAMVYGFFGEKWLPGMSELMCLVAVLAGLLFLRREPLWTLLIFGTVAITLLLVAVPRYYIMVLPLMALAWILLTSEFALRVPHRWLEVVLVLGIIALALPNFARCCKVIGEQRGWHNQEEGPKWKYVMDMAKSVHDIVPPGEKVIAPGASIMKFLSDREVVMQKDIIPANKARSQWPAVLAREDIRWAVFPSNVYRKAERSIRELMDRGVIVPTERVQKVGDLVLAKVTIVEPPPGTNWWEKPVQATLTAKLTPSGTTRPSTTQIAKKKRHVASVKKEAAHKKALADARHRKAVQLARQKALAAKKRKAARLRREAQRAATQHTTSPATTPATQPTTAPSALIEGNCLPLTVGPPRIDFS